MASISSLMSSGSSSSIYGSRNSNIISGLASGMDTEAMIEGMVQGYQQKITQLGQDRTMLQWQQSAYQSISDKLVEFSRKYMSYNSPATNLFSASFFNNAILTSANGTYADLVSATGKSSSTIVLNAVKQLAEAARYTHDASGLDTSLGKGEPVKLGEKQPLSTMSGSLTLEYGNKKVTLEALSQRESLRLSASETGTVKPNDLKIGKLVDDLLKELLDTLGALFASQGDNNDVAKQLATQYLEATKVNGLYNPAKVVQALQNGQQNAASQVNLPALGDWTTDVPGCKYVVLVCMPAKVPGSVWEGFKRETGISDISLVGGLLDALGLTACDGLINGLLRYNDCVRDALVKYLQTKPGGLSGAGGYNPTTGTGSCSSGLCLLLKPVVDGFLRPLLDGVGKLLRDVLSEVLGLQLGRTDVHMQSIQCGRSQLVE